MGSPWEALGVMGRIAGKLKSSIVFAVLMLMFGICFASASPVGFDVRQHLSTTTRYGAGKAYAGNVEEIPHTPKGCVPIHLNLVARHGTRSPTLKRIKELDALVARITKLSENPKEGPKRPDWLQGFQSPWHGRKVGGELTPAGEREMYELGQRLRHRYQELFQYDYHPDIYPITATQVSRSAASAVAFGMGLFEGKGDLGEAKYRAFSVITDSRKSDIHLRFHESCMAYKESKRIRKPAVDVWQNEVYTQIATSMDGMHNLNLTQEDVGSLWLLCKQEASILDITDRACGLFNAGEVELLEWADDVQAHHLKGYGEAINYRMGVPLLEDVIKTMERAISASEGSQVDGAVESAKLRVAHAETIIPFTCLLGLFLENTDISRLQSEEPLAHPLRPPHQRKWKGSLVAPFGANTAIVLHKCLNDSNESKNAPKTEENSSHYLVQVLHNENPVSMPACRGAHFCPFSEFKDSVAGPHLKHSFESLCAVEIKHKPVTKSWGRKLILAVSSIFRWPWQSTDPLAAPSHSCKDEL